MSRGIGQAQRYLLTSIAAIEEHWPLGARAWHLIRLWVVADGREPRAVNHANLYRALRRLERRGLITMTDRADYAPFCQCGHSIHDHDEERGQCRSSYVSGPCRCARYRDLPSRPPRAWWHANVTDAGRPLVDERAQARLAAAERARHQDAAAADAQMEVLMGRHN
jgi:hypothetical protein